MRNDIFKTLGLYCYCFLIIRHAIHSAKRPSMRHIHQACW